MTESDKAIFNDLLKKLVKGDKSAYNTIYEKFYQVIFCYVLDIIRDSEIAKDITHDAFLVLLCPDFKIPRFTNPYAYFFQIAKNKLYDYLRREGNFKKYIEMIVNDLKQRARLDENSFGESPITYEDLFEGLSKWEEQLILLRYDSGYKVYEISKRLGVSKRTLNRDFGAIKKKLSKRQKELRNR